jgi:hypothetical protein
MLVNLKLYHRNSPAIIDGLNATIQYAQWDLDKCGTVPERGEPGSGYWTFLIEPRRAVLKWLASLNTKRPAVSQSAGPPRNYEVSFLSYLIAE